jgi:hypothetical protein
MGEEEQWGIVFRDFIRQSVQEWSGMERDEGQQRRGMIKASPAASCTRESAIIHGVGQSRVGRDAEWKRGTSGTKGGHKAKAKGEPAGRTAGQRAQLPHPTGLPLTFSMR